MKTDDLSFYPRYYQIIADAIPSHLNVKFQFHIFISYLALISICLGKSISFDLTPDEIMMSVPAR